MSVVQLHMISFCFNVVGYAHFTTMFSCGCFSVVRTMEGSYTPFEACQLLSTSLVTHACTACKLSAARQAHSVHPSCACATYLLPCAGWTGTSGCPCPRLPCSSPASWAGPQAGLTATCPAALPKWQSLHYKGRARRTLISSSSSSSSNRTLKSSSKVPGWRRKSRCVTGHLIVANGVCQWCVPMLPMVCANGVCDWAFDCCQWCVRGGGYMRRVEREGNTDRDLSQTFSVFGYHSPRVEASCDAAWLSELKKSVMHILLGRGRRHS